MEAFQWYKATLEFLKGNKVILLIVTTALASGTAGYHIPKGTVVEPVEVGKTTLGCGWCGSEIKKLKRWHK